jgi:fatty acid desaturase
MGVFSNVSVWEHCAVGNQSFLCGEVYGCNTIIFIIIIIFFLCLHSFSVVDLKVSSCRHFALNFSANRISCRTSRTDGALPTLIRRKNYHVSHHSYPQFRNGYSERLHHTPDLLTLCLTYCHYAIILTVVMVSCVQ